MPFQDLEIEHADQAVAELDVVIEERERAAGLCPSIQSATLQRSTASGFCRPRRGSGGPRRGSPALRLGRRLGLAGAHPRQLLADPPGRGEQEVPRAGGRVDDLEIEQRALFGLRVFALASRSSMSGTSAKSISS